MPKFSIDLFINETSLSICFASSCCCFLFSSLWLNLKAKNAPASAPKSAVKKSEVGSNHLGAGSSVIARLEKYHSNRDPKPTIKPVITGSYLYSFRFLSFYDLDELVWAG